MSGFLSSFFRQPSSDAGENGSELKSSGASYVSTSGAASWVTMTQPDGGRGEPMMRVNQDTVDEVLEPLGDEEPVNIIAIFGAARGGKSFLMNQLAGKDGIFKISNEKDPCTQGVDVSRAVVPLRDFSSIHGCTAPKGVSRSTVRVCFADVEGQGDRDVTYDARLASAILPLTKCVIFNWRDSLQVDRILNLLGVMQRAAHNVDLGDDGSGSMNPKFGHLHVVFRDWNYSGTAEEVKKQLFGLDKRGMGVEVAMKNELRRTIMAAFASVTVWLFPAPVEMTSELSKELKSEDLSLEFLVQLAGLRSALSSQLAEPMGFGLANPITGHSLGSLVPAMVDVLNSGDIIMPESAYQQMLDKEAERLKKTYLEKADVLIETGMSACDNGPPVPPANLEVDMEEAIRELLDEFEREAKGIGAKEEVVAEAAREIRASLERGMTGLRAHNGSALARHLKVAVKEARAKFTEEFTQACRAFMPLPLSELSAMSSAAAARARARLQEVPSLGAGDDSLQEALSALEDFVELAVSKAERENDAVEKAQHKAQEDALVDAILAFDQGLRADLDAVKAGGGPYKLAHVEAAVEAALASATSVLQGKLPKSGGDRLDGLMGRLRERARTAMVEEKSAFDSSCSDHMMRLATEERRRLRGETAADVYPLLPLYSTPELESAFRPVVERMNGRIELSAQGWALSAQARAQHLDSAKSDAESAWQSLYERNERVKLEHEKQAVGEDAERQREEARRLKDRLEQERQKVVEAENNARGATEAAANARLAATEANQRARRAVGEQERAAAAREKEKREEEVRRAEEREKAAAEAARMAAAVRTAEQERFAAEKKAAEARAAEARAEVARAAEARAAEATAEQARAAKAREARLEKARAAEARAAEARVAEARAREAEAEKAREAEARVAEERLARAREAEARAAETSAANVKAAEERAREVKAVEVKLAEAREAEARLAEAREAEARLAEARLTVARAAEAEARAAEAEARAAEAKVKEQQNNSEGFEDAMEEDEEEMMTRKRTRSGKGPAREEAGEEEGGGEVDEAGKEEEEDEPKRKVPRRNGRRDTILTPIGKDPAALKRAREEAAKQIKDREDAKVGKGGATKGEDQHAGLSAVEMSRMRAKEWAQQEKVRKEALAKKKKAALAAGTASSEPRAGVATRKRASGKKK